ncbi:hypothetical protein [Halomicrobium salinisoli]|uniref:hypothetical protein n=1 Tax=Halomicrobium salinisoli TaxID=2878391 RepID=UPI001CF06522|nr:hypothetical protein [Halomicrobium salinisoli]
MESQLYSGVVFALYQLSVLAGILLLPVALLARRLGLSVPMHRVVRRLEAAHESVQPA